MDKLQSTTLHQAGIMYAHSEYNHPIPGITVNIPLDHLLIWQNKLTRKYKNANIPILGTYN